MATRTTTTTPSDRADAAYVCATSPAPHGADAGTTWTRWRDGPVEAAGRCFDASARNLLCMDVYTPSPRHDTASRGSRCGGSGATLCVVGSADHGLRVFDVTTLRALSPLYGARAGHTEWVTACKFLSDARVLSGGMDSKLCLWADVTRPGPARCVDLLGHTGSISQIDVSASHTRAISASYDGTLRVWSCDAAATTSRSGTSALACLSGHEAAVTAFAWSRACADLVSADRRGNVKLWDVATATCVATLPTQERRRRCRGGGGGSGSGHSSADALGAVAQLELGSGATSSDANGHSSSRHGNAGSSGGVTLLGDQQGMLTVLDWRAAARGGDRNGSSAHDHAGVADNKNNNNRSSGSGSSSSSTGTSTSAAAAVVCTSMVHPGAVLSGIRGVDGTHYVVTCGADKRVALLDARRNFDVVHVFAEHTDHVYALETHGPLVLSGGGNGWLLVHDTTTLQCCYGLGASTDAVRAIHASSDHLIAACDDGKAMVYDYTSM